MVITSESEKKLECVKAARIVRMFVSKSFLSSKYSIFCIFVSPATTIIAYYSPNRLSHYKNKAKYLWDFFVLLECPITGRYASEGKTHLSPNVYNFTKYAIYYFLVRVINKPKKEKRIEVGLITIHQIINLSSVIKKIF